MKQMLEFIYTEQVKLLLRLVKLVILILFLNHYIACLWYAMAIWTNDSVTWLDRYVLTVDGLESHSGVLLYFTSLHWSLTQFTPATMDVAPTNATERAFAVFIVLFALMCFSSFV